MTKAETTNSTPPASGLVRSDLAPATLLPVLHALDAEHALNDARGLDTPDGRLLEFRRDAVEDMILAGRSETLADAAAQVGGALSRIEYLSCLELSGHEAEQELDRLRDALASATRALASALAVTPQSLAPAAAHLFGDRPTQPAAQT